MRAGGLVAFPARPAPPAPEAEQSTADPPRERDPPSAATPPAPEQAAPED